MSLETLKTKVGLLIEKAQSGGGNAPENAVYTISEYAENGYPKKIKYRIPQGLEQNQIPDYAFGNKTDLNSSFAESFEEVEVVGNPNIIGANAFYRCTALKRISCYDYITNAKYACFNRTVLEYSYLPPNLIEIGDYSFALVPFSGGELEFPQSVLTIGEQAFYQCEKLKKITFKGTPQTISSKAFYMCRNITDVFVPWSEGTVSGAPWGVSSSAIHYNSEV